jgi:hypothetical protein
LVAATAEEAHTYFLASRSNYQNLIEGTHVPGVNYPTELSTNLTSKRTSHKIAEQGRRNRINTALQEMLTLLPKGSVVGSSKEENSPGAGSDESSRKKSDAFKANGNSKASTVESAIDYIKALQYETAEKAKAVEERERECDRLKRKLAEMEKLLDEKGPQNTPGASESEG